MEPHSHTYRSQAARLRTSRSAGRAAAALLLAAGLAIPANAGVYSWIGGNGLWNDPTKWLPNGVPGSDDEIYIGNLQTAQNATVMFAPPGFIYGLLEVSDGMVLDLNGGELVSFGPATIDGAGSKIVARPSPFGNQHDFQGELHVGFGAELELVDNVEVRLFDNSFNGGTISGRGTVLISSNDPFINQGIINPGNNGGLTIVQGANDDGIIDIDGFIKTGEIVMDIPFDQLTVEAGELIDPFSAPTSMVPGTGLTMNIDNDWSADATFEIIGQNWPAAASQISGSDLTMNGDFNVGADEAHLRVLSNTTLSTFATADIQPDGWLEFDGETIVEDGVYVMGVGAKLEFDGPTTMAGGEFHSASNQWFDGYVNFKGETEWNGVVTLNGVARQTGDAEVLGPTLVHANSFDLGGGVGATHWTLVNSLTVNADEINFGSNVFNGTFDLAAGLLGKLTINLSDPFEPWYMRGTMDLVGAGGFAVQRIYGSPMIVEGQMNLVGGFAQINADTIFSTEGIGASVDLGPAGAGLRLSGVTHVGANTAFSGLGMLINLASGEMTLHDGVSLGLADLFNSGLLDVGVRSGTASVNTFESAATATFHASIGGHIQGDEHDLLIVSGGLAQLDGEIEVDLIDLGMGTFTPTIGDQFTVISALAGVSGGFVNDPVTIEGANQYEWTVVYEPNAVVLVLDDITPAPTCCVGNADNVVPGQVDFADVTAVLARWLDPGDGSDAGDANCDGIVDFSDITAVLSNWLDLCP